MENRTTFEVESGGENDSGRSHKHQLVDCPFLAFFLSIQQRELVQLERNVRC